MLCDELARELCLGPPGADHGGVADTAGGSHIAGGSRGAWNGGGGSGGSGSIALPAAQGGEDGRAAEAQGEEEEGKGAK